MKVSVFNEFGKLTDVVVADVITYFDHEAINDNQSLYYKTNPPNKDVMIQQQREFFETLHGFDIKMHFATKLFDCPDQLNTRDPSFVIGDTFYVSSMKESLRAKEKTGLVDILDKIESKKVYLDDCTIEGGDVLVHYDTVFVGISRRTTLKGVEILSQHTHGFTIVPIQLKPGFLHLDTVFNIISDDIALVCLEAIEPSSIEKIAQRFKVIDITLEEHLHLGTNVFSVAPKVLISQTYNKRINTCLRQVGCEVVEIEYAEIAKLGGAFRCGTCPLIRI